MAQLLYANQYKTTSLSVSGGIDASQTTSIVIQSTSGIDTSKPGIALLSYSDPLDTDVAEWIEYSAINSTTKELTGVTRASEGYSSKTHANAVTVAFPLSESHINRINNKLTGSDTGVTLTDPVIDIGFQTASDGATITFDLGSGKYTKQQATLGGNRTLALSNELVGMVFMIDLIQDATGSRTVTWFSGISWAGGSAPTLTTTANKRDSFGFVVTGAGAYSGYVIGQNI